MIVASALRETISKLKIVAQELMDDRDANDVKTEKATRKFFPSALLLAEA